MQTTQDLFNALLRLDADQFIEVTCDEATKESLRISLVKMLARYRNNCRAYMDTNMLPGALRCDWDADASIARFSIGSKRRASRTVEFTIKSTAPEVSEWEQIANNITAP